MTKLTKCDSCGFAWEPSARERIPDDYNREGAKYLVSTTHGIVNSVLDSAAPYQMAEGEVVAEIKISGLDWGDIAMPHDLCRKCYEGKLRAVIEALLEGLKRG